MNTSVCQPSERTPIFEHSIAMFEKKFQKNNHESCNSFVNDHSSVHWQNYIFESESVKTRALELLSKKTFPMWTHSAHHRIEEIEVRKQIEQKNHDLSGLDEQGNFSTTHYLKSKKIEYHKLLNGNGNYAISLSGFATIFNSDEHPKTLTFLAKHIDAVIIDEQRLATLYLIPPKYLRAIQQLWFSKDYAVMPPKEMTVKPSSVKLRYDMDKILYLFSNATKLYGLHPYAIDMPEPNHPCSYFAFALRAELLIQVNITEAQADIAKTKHLDIHYPITASVHANLLLTSGDCDQAEYRARQAIKSNPKYLKAHEILSGALHQKGNHGDSRKVLENIVKLNPKSAYAYAGLASFLTDEGRVEEAEQMARKALELDPEYSPAHRTLGIIFAKKKDWKNADQSLMKAVYMDPRCMENYEVSKKITNKEKF